MRMCKCGKANQPTRKYCIRCGESLIGQKKKEKPVAPAPEPAPPMESPPEETSSYKPVGAPDKMSPTTDDEWVRPSEVETDRVRTAEQHIEKTELEKAQEAFEEGETADPDERMLLASEIKELMAEGSAESIVEEKPAPVDAPTPSTPIPPPSIPEVVPTPEPQPAPEVSTNIPEPLETPVAPTPTETPPTPTPEPPVIEESAATGFSPVTTQPPVTDPDLDKRIQEIDSDIAQFTIQVQQYQTELEEIRSRNEGNIKWANTVAEQKRIRVDSLEDDLRRAKEEFNLASKDLRNGKNRMKKEVSDAEKRVSDLQKRITNAGKAREKRLKEIEKEKAKSN